MFFWNISGSVKYTSVLFVGVEQFLIFSSCIIFILENLMHGMVTRNNLHPLCTSVWLHLTQFRFNSRLINQIRYLFNLGLFDISRIDFKLGLWVADVISCVKKLLRIPNNLRELHHLLQVFVCLRDWTLICVDVIYWSS